MAALQASLQIKLKEGIMLSLKQFTLQGICLLLPP